MRKLFNDPPPRTRALTGRGSIAPRSGTFKAGYGTPAKARKTIKRLATKPCSYRRRVAGTMYARAKYHAHQTANMRASMKLYKSYLSSFSC